MIVRSTHDLAVTVRGRRKDLGLSQADLAARAGVSRKWVYEFEAAKPTVEVGRLLQVLDALDLELHLGARSPGSGRGVVDLDALLADHRDDAR